ncbi:MAG: hypothetical protein Q4Q62_01670 [Thermoplasmata archaeon]|nr:hypothetical protein [Thermoplasmata archaeon]
MSEACDVMLFVCGGGACHVIREHEPSSMPVVMLNPDSPDEDTEAAFRPAAHAVARAAVEEHAELVSRMRIVFVYAILGGDMGSILVSEVTKYAQEAGCRVVAVAGIPWEEGTPRRGRALDMLPEVVASADRTLVSDGLAVAKLMDDNVRTIDSIVRASGYAMQNALDSLAQLAEGPFFSTLPESAYTYSYVKDLDPVRAVERAMDATAFPTDPAYGKMTVTVSSAFGRAQLEEVFEAVVSRTGIIPEIVKRDDREDTRVLVFLPVRLSPSSPRASRS